MQYTNRMLLKIILRLIFIKTEGIKFFFSFFFVKRLKIYLLNEYVWIIRRFHLILEYIYALYKIIKDHADSEWKSATGRITSYFRVWSSRKISIENFRTITYSIFRRFDWLPISIHCVCGPLYLFNKYLYCIYI